jgi:hypothetical protein
MGSGAGKAAVRHGGGASLHGPLGLRPTSEVAAEKEDATAAATSIIRKTAGAGNDGERWPSLETPSTAASDDPRMIAEWASESVVERGTPLLLAGGNTKWVLDDLYAAQDENSFNALVARHWQKQAEKYALHDAEGLRPMRPIAGSTLMSRRSALSEGGSHCRDLVDPNELMLRMS